MRGSSSLLLQLLLLVALPAARTGAARVGRLEQQVDWEYGHQTRDDHHAAGRSAALYPKCGQTPGYRAWDREISARAERGESRYTGGSYQHYGQFPSYVGLVIPKAKGGTTFCGGTLISRRHVLTAAHCLQNRTRLDANFRVLLGPLQPHKYNVSANAVVANVPVSSKAPACIAPGHRPVDFPTPDWAVVELAHEVRFGPYVQPACLPGVNSPPQRLNARTCWGVGAGIGSAERRDTPGGGSTWIRHYPLWVKKLRMVQVDCGDEQVHPSKVCYANADTTTKGQVCSGDSGGPVLCRDEAPRRWTLAALASGASGEPGVAASCGENTEARATQIYTDVGRILDEMRRLCSWMKLP